MHRLVNELNKLIEEKRTEAAGGNSDTSSKADSDGKLYKLYHGETWELLARRWNKLEREFLNVKTNLFDISKIPDIYDCIKYDLLHNKSIFLRCPLAEELYTYAKNMADVVVPQEYGMTQVSFLSVNVRQIRTLFAVTHILIFNHLNDESLTN